MARIKASYLVVTNFTEGRGLNHQTSEMCTGEDWKRALGELSRDCRPTRQNVLSNGSVPNPLPLYWCEDCDCWVLSKKHEHDRSRVPQEGDVWAEDCTRRIIPSGVELGKWERINWETDPRVVTTIRGIVFEVTRVVHEPGYDAWEFRGIKYGAAAPYTCVHYTRILTGDWSEDEVFADSEKEIEDTMTLKRWRKNIKGMVLQCNSDEVQS